MNPLSIYFHSISASFEQASRAVGNIDRQLAVDGHTVKLNFGGTALLPMILPALAHLQTTSVEISHGASHSGRSKPLGITFCLWDAASTGVYPPPPPFIDADYHRYGQRAVKYEGANMLLHDRANQSVCAFDRAARQGIFWTADANALSIYERAAPLQTLFHWALGEYGWQIIHAAALGIEAGGVLLIGNSGAGKSTTALACLQYEHLHYLSDDKCLVNLDPEPRVVGLFNSAKLKDDSFERLAQFQPLAVGRDDTYKAGKSLLHLYPAFRQQMVAAFPIKAILLCQITNAPNPSLSKVSPIEVLRVLGPSTIIWLSGAEASSLRLIANLAERLPGYRLHLAQNPSDNLELIADTLQRHL